MKRIELTLLACLMAVLAWGQELDFTHGVFFVNEDRYGANQGSINFYDYEYEEMEYNVFAMANPGIKLGVTSQHAQLFGNRLFVVSKQANGNESSGNTMGSRLAVLDAVTLKQQSSLLRFGPADSTYDGRAYCAVNNAKGYVSTNAGIFVINVPSMTVSGPIQGTESSARGDYNSLYFEQCGDMVRFGQYVFAVQQGRGLHVINPMTDRIVATLPFPDIVTVFVTAGGNLYVANNSREVYDFGTGPVRADFTRIDPVSFATLAVHELGDKGAVRAWGAWHARMLCVDPAAEKVYYSHEEYQNYISCYDFSSSELTDTLILLPDAAEVNWQGLRNRQGLYASALSFDPHTGDMVVQTTEAAPMYAYEIFDHNWVLFYDVATGTLNRQIRLRDAYWFPALAVYPDRCEPSVYVEDQSIPEGEEIVVPLLQAVRDNDNMAALAVTTASSADESVVLAWVSGLELHLKGVGKGVARISLTTDSNGRMASCSFSAIVTGSSTVGDLNMDGRVNMSDVTKLIEVLLGSVLADYDPAAGDVNGDHQLNVADLVALIALILNS